MCIQHIQLSFKFLELIKLALNKIRKPFRIKWREIFCKLKTQYCKLTGNPRVSARGACFKSTRRRRALIPGRRLFKGVGGTYFIFFQIMAWDQLFFNTSSVRKQQHKQHKSWPWSLNRGTVRTWRVQSVQQCTSLIILDKNHTSFVVPLFIPKMGGGEGALSLNFSR